MKDTVTKIISVIQLKGGAGKSTVATNLAAMLAERGRTLLIDADSPQYTSECVTHPEEEIMAKPSAAKATNLSRVPTMQEEKGYSSKSKFPRADQRRITSNLQAENYEALRTASARLRMPAGEILDDLISNYIHKVKGKEWMTAEKAKKL